MFKKSERLSQSEFAAYFKTGRRHQFPHLTIITLPVPPRKMSVVVGKKVAKSAVRRNTIKRRIYAALRVNPAVEIFKGVMIVLVKPTYNSLPRKVADDFLNQAIAQVLKSA